MLPEDTSARKKAAVLAQQATLDPHLRERSPTEQVIHYSDDLFQEAAIAWLVSTDQVRRAAPFKHLLTSSLAYPSI